MARRGPSSVSLRSSSTSEVLVGELVGETGVGIVGARGTGSRLIASRLGIVVPGLALILGVLVLGKVTLGRITTSVSLLLGLKARLLTRSGREDGLRKGRGRGGIGGPIRGGQPVIAVPKVEEQAVVVGIHPF